MKLFGNITLDIPSKKNETRVLAGCSALNLKFLSNKMTKNFPILKYLKNRLSAI